MVTFEALLSIMVPKLKCNRSVVSCNHQITHVQYWPRLSSVLGHWLPGGVLPVLHQC